MTKLVVGANKIIAFLLLPITVCINSGFGQALVPPQGQMSVSMYYQYGEVKRHLFSSDVIDENGVNLGRSFDFGSIHSHSLFFGVDYGISSRMGISFGIPITYSRYNGDAPENLATDNGDYHGSFQDFSLRVRYMALVRPVAITPSIGLVIPSNYYETFGHTSVGRRVTEVHIGISIGRLMTLISDNLYTEFSYDYSLSGKVEEMQLGRGSSDLSLVYFVTPSISVSANVLYQNSVGGIDWLDNMDDQMFQDHDRFASADILDVTGSLSYGVSDIVTVYGSLSKLAWGGNTHDLMNVTIGTTLNFWLID